MLALVNCLMKPGFHTLSKLTLGVTNRAGVIRAEPHSRMFRQGRRVRLIFRLSATFLLSASEPGAQNGPAVRSVPTELITAHKHSAHAPYGGEVQICRNYS